MNARTAMVVAAVMITGAVKADTALDITGQLLPPFCTVHNGSRGTISVDFGDEINVNRLDGVLYRKTVSYQIDCESDGQPWLLRLKLTGAPAWDNQTLQTSKSGLGLRFLVDGSRVELDRNIPIASRTSPPVLTVTPVKNVKEMPDEGAFSAAANLLAEYY